MRQAMSGMLWLEWTLATLIGYAVGTLAVLPLAVQLAYTAQPAWLPSAAGGVVLGATISGAQWLVLRHNRQGTGAWWVPASMVGGLLGLALGATLSDALVMAAFRPTDRETAALMLPLRAALTTGVTGLVFGLCLGVFQWLALRRPPGMIVWWVAANGLGWMAGMGLGAAVADRITTIGALLVTGIVAGVATGSAIQWWVRQATDNTSAEHQDAHL
jgi:hypothetical protein